MCMCTYVHASTIHYSRAYYHIKRQVKKSGDAATSTSTSTMERPTYEDIMPGDCTGLYSNTNWSGKSAAAAVALCGDLTKDGFIPAGQTIRVRDSSGQVTEFNTFRPNGPQPNRKQFCTICWTVLTDGTRPRHKECKPKGSIFQNPTFTQWMIDEAKANPGSKIAQSRLKHMKSFQKKKNAESLDDDDDDDEESTKKMQKKKSAEKPKKKKKAGGPKCKEAARKRNADKTAKASNVVVEETDVSNVADLIVPKRRCTQNVSYKN